MMLLSAKRVFRHILIGFVVLSIGFVLSSGIAFDATKKVSDKTMATIMERFSHHILTLGIDAKHYFLLPMGSYTKDQYTQPLSFTMLACIFTNAVFNILFQPVFICPFSLQVIINLVLFPFFLYGAFSCFKKIWILLVAFMVLSFQLGVYDSGVEALIRHGMSCELIYLLIGSAGCAGWITKN